MPHSTKPTSEIPQLHVNDGPLEPDQVALLKPTTMDTPISEMRSRYETDGYLYLKNLLPRKDVLAARSAYFTLLSVSGVLKPGTTPEQGIFDSAKDPANFPGIGSGVASGVDLNGRPSGTDPAIAAKFVDLALQAHYEDWYRETFCRHPDLLEFVTEFTGWGEHTKGVQRTLLRNNTPGNKATGVHYDMIFLRHGEDTALTAWCPLGDVSITGGGLIYLENGHTLGAEIEREFTAKAKSAGMSDEEAKNAFNQNMIAGGMLSNGPAEFGKFYDRRWLATDYEAGDVVLHNAYAIHASTMNNDPNDVIRVGTDLRFVDSSKPYDTRWNNDFAFGDGV